MTDRILQIADDFWNIRGEFKIGGVLNIGTHASLVKRANGQFVLLDAYTLQGEVRSRLMPSPIMALCWKLSSICTRSIPCM